MSFPVRGNYKYVVQAGTYDTGLPIEVQDYLFDNNIGLSKREKVCKYQLTQYQELPYCQARNFPTVQKYLYFTPLLPKYSQYSCLFRPCDYPTERVTLENVFYLIFPICLYFIFFLIIIFQALIFSCFVCGFCWQFWEFYRFRYGTVYTSHHFSTYSSPGRECW